jgi:Zn-dependent protease
MEIHFIFQIIVLIISIMAHEVAHGASAYAFGDPTARNQGRLTLNPLKHIDLFGSIILPLILILTKAGFIFGWAKPVPYNPYNLNPRRLGEFCVAIAGIVTNFTIAIFFSIIIRNAEILNLSNQAVNIILYIIFINVVLAVFNLFPVPPLDGSKILFTLIPYRYERHLVILERYGFYFLIILIVFFGPLISGVVNFFLTLFLP